MSETLFDTALGKVRERLLIDFPDSKVEAFPFDVDPHVLAESGLDWPESGAPLFTIIDGAIVRVGDRGRAPQGVLAPAQQEGHAEVIAWFRGESLTALASDVRKARRALFESIETVAKRYPWGYAGEWGIDWAKGDVKPTRLNTGFYVAIRAAIVVSFME